MSNTATIEKGSKVKVSFEAEYKDVTALGRHILVDPTLKDAGLLAPAGAKVEVIEPPLPKQPPVGELVKASWSNTIYRRDYDGWYRLTGTPQKDAAGKRLHYSWRKLIDEWGVGVLQRVVTDPTAGAEDMKDDPYVIKDKPSGGMFNGRMSAQLSGYEVKFSLPCGDAVTIPDYRAREFALAILKATGGL